MESERGEFGEAVEKTKWRSQMSPYDLTRGRIIFRYK
jgi:hypothetical protein